jgi:hypothetical protein
MARGTALVERFTVEGGGFRFTVLSCMSASNPSLKASAVMVWQGGIAVNLRGGDLEQTTSHSPAFATQRKRLSVPAQSR